MQTRLQQRLQQTGPKKIISLDGGGIRGVLTIEILAQIETLIREQYQDPNLVLADYFDFVAGTSTGAIIGAGIAIGLEVAQIREFYHNNAKNMFDRASLWTRTGSLFGYKYNDRKLAHKLQEVFGVDTTLGSEQLQTLLLIVMHNAKTDSPWPISNNPYAKYNDLTSMGTHSNLHLPLWQLVRASAAAPFYFPPEKIVMQENEFIFIDGSITPYNNPAFQAFIMATLRAYRLNWSCTQQQLLLVSIGTGTNALKLPGLEVKDMHLLHLAASMPAHLINAAQYQQDMLCRIFGDCRAGAILDSEIEALQGEISLGCGAEKLFTYLRYDLELSQSAFAELGLANYPTESLKRLDAIENIADLQTVGKVFAEQRIQTQHFTGFW